MADLDAHLDSAEIKLISGDWKLCCAKNILPIS